MNKKSLSEVYGIIQIMDDSVVNRIPVKFLNFIKNNRDVFYNPKFDKLPDNFDNLEHDTKVMFALIYKKYFSDITVDYPEALTEQIKQTIDENQSTEITDMIVYDNGIKAWFKNIFSKLKNWLFKK